MERISKLGTTLAVTSNWTHCEEAIRSSQTSVLTRRHIPLRPSSVQIFSSTPCSQTLSVYVAPLMSETTFHTHTEPKAKFATPTHTAYMKTIRYQYNGRQLYQLPKRRVYYKHPSIQLDSMLCYYGDSGSRLGSETPPSLNNYLLRIYYNGNIYCTRPDVLDSNVRTGQCEYTWGPTIC
jgi:hypothetical protein